MPGLVRAAAVATAKLAEGGQTGAQALRWRVRRFGVARVGADSSVGLARMAATRAADVDRVDARLRSVPVAPA